MNDWMTEPWSHCAVQLADLSFPEQLLLFTVRKQVEMRARPVDIQDLAKLHEICFGIFGIAHIEKSLAAFRGFLTVLFAGSRRIFRVHHFLCGSVSMDEWRLLALIAAHQAEHFDYAAALTRWLVSKPHARDLTRHAAALAEIMKNRDLVCPSASVSPSRCRRTAGPRPRTPRRTLPYNVLRHGPLVSGSMVSLRSITYRIILQIIFVMYAVEKR